ncbi:MAG: DNA mismatch repair protein MutS, partial [Chloroflexota bacterium]|nr:DNA mismatch repair protein MutS [Chloroflexota bacterium]
MTTTEPKLTPLRRQYLDIKQQQPDAILFFRLGDFYEMFDEDAERAAAVLQIVLTSREFGKGNRVSMCGVPYHAAPTYIGRLIEAGLRVAVCDQVGEVGRGLVERQVTRVITPGTVLDEDWLKPEANNYLAVAVGDGDARGLAYADITTGDLAACEASPQALSRELARLDAREMLTLGLPEGEVPSGVPQDDQAWLRDPAAAREMVARHFQVRDLEGLGLQGRPLATHAVGVLLRYVEDTDPAALHVLTGVHVYGTSDFMELDAFTRRNLELETAGRDARREGSLLAVLDRTHTPMGARRLREQLTRPLIDRARLEQRLDRVQVLLDDPGLRALVQAALDRVGDLERLANRVVRRAVSASDVRHLAAALDAVTELRETLDAEKPALADLRDALDPCTEARALIERAVTERGNQIIRPGYSAELDRVVDAATEAKGWIAGLERREREATGLRGLKVGYNRVFGYYLEVGRAYSEQVPESYQRRQTLANAERYVTPELKEYESRVLGAEERIADLERTLFDEVVDHLSAVGPSLQRTALALAALDVAAGLAEVAERQGYVRPDLTEGDALEIESGRHPVVELAQHERFVPNDSFLDPAERQIAVLTGPNMAGKSTYLRQVALIVLMAQVGSFVPAA